MRWASALSTRDASPDALDEAARAVETQLEGRPADLVLAFFSGDHVGSLPVLAQGLAERFPAATVVGCTGLGVIGAAREIEGRPALSLNAASLPEVAVRAVHLDMRDLPADGPPAWHRLLGTTPEVRPALLLLADPYTFDAEPLVEALDAAYPGSAKVGGLVSGGRRPGEHRLLLGRDVHRTGAVVVALSGRLEVDAVVAQGCRPIGVPMVVTRCQGGLVLELDRGAPVEVLGRLYGSLDARDQELMRHALFVGIDQRSGPAGRDAGDLLVRNIIGFDQPRGALTVAAELRPLQVIQFVLRDAHTAEQDLRRHLQRRRRDGARPGGALLFSCTGRGEGLFGCADHDSGLFEELLGPTPLGGFFCNGEIGPVGATTFLHGYTSAFALFQEPSPPGAGAAQRVQ